MAPRTPTRRARGARAATAVLATFGLAAFLAACSSSPGSGSGASASSVSCSGVSGAHHVRVVVEASASKIVSRCVGFSTPTIAATSALTKSQIEFGTQQYSFGLAICQADDVPAHYSQCLPSSGNYWALFVSNGGSAWTSPNVGVSDVVLHDGDSIGLRYDPQTGTSAPPPRPTRA